MKLKKTQLPGETWGNQGHAQVIVHPNSTLRDRSHTAEAAHVQRHLLSDTRISPTHPVTELS